MTDAAPNTDARDLLRVIDLASRVHYRLAALAEAVRGDDGQNAGRREVLRNLSVLGPSTVPQLAALRPVSRQFIQRVVDELKAEGLVETRPNPAHRRSVLVGLTAKGLAAVRILKSADRALLDTLSPAFTGPHLAEAQTFLTELAEALERLLRAGRAPRRRDKALSKSRRAP